MNNPSLPIRFLVAGAACVCLSGCLNLKPARATARYFVLSPLTNAAPAIPAPGSPPPLAVGLGQVRLPGYLFKKSLAIRKGANEVDYLETALWAENLSNDFQRVLAANLATLLPTDQVRLSAWRRDFVAMEVYVAVEQFDTDVSGRSVLAAWWRIVSPGGDRLFKGGQSRAPRRGPPPQADPQGTTAMLSELIADFSREVTEAIRAVAKDALQRSGP
jgi:uncharacterized lipoprotein YmbA